MGICPDALRAGGGRVSLPTSASRQAVELDTEHEQTSELQLGVRRSHPTYQLCGRAAVSSAKCSEKDLRRYLQAEQLRQSSEQERSWLVAVVRGLPLGSHIVPHPLRVSEPAGGQFINRYVCWP
jgi:hypothetical protein